jgi:hypothetical protein
MLQQRKDMPSWTKFIHFLEKGICIPNPKQFIGMLKGWRIGRISVKKKTRLLK